MTRLLLFSMAYASMADACLNLFRYAADHVTPADVKAFAPGDPGYPDFVREFTGIWESRRLPRRSSFEITETIGLTRWRNADREADPQRFRRFRTFINSVGMAMYIAGLSDSDTTPGNYCAISLIDDASALNDADLLALLGPAFNEFHAALRRDKSEEAPFLLLADILINLRRGTDPVQMSGLAEALMAEEAEHFGRASTDFLWGCTSFNQLHRQWKHHVEQLLPPATPTLKLLREALLCPR